MISEIKEKDRVAEGEISAQNHVTTYADAIAVEKSAPEKPVNLTYDPYPPGEVVAALTRSYRVSTVTWNVGSVSESLLQTLDFPDALFQLPFLQDKLKYYRFFRSKAKIGLRLNTTKFEFGALLVTWQPRYDDGGSNAKRMLDMFTASFCNPIIVSAQTADTVEFELPHLCPFAWDDVNTTFPVQGQIKFWVLHKLSSASADAPSDVEVQVYANLFDVNLSGYAPDFGPSSSAVVAKARTVRAMEAKKRTVKMLIAGKSTPLKKKVEEATAQSKTGTVKEAQKKSETGLLSGIAEAVSTIAPVVAPIFPEAIPIGIIAKSLSPIFKSLGLSMPTDRRAMAPFFDRKFGTPNYGRGLDPSVKLTFDPDAELAVSSAIIDGNPNPTLSEIVQTPSLILYGSFTKTTSTGDKILDLVCAPWGYRYDGTYGTGKRKYRLTYAAYYARFFKFWKGGLKFFIKFCTSSFVTCRVRVTHMLSEITTPMDKVSGDIVSEVHHISGDTTIEVDAHFLYKEMYKLNYNPDPGLAFNPFNVIRITLETPVVSTDASAAPPIFYSVWQAAAEDFQYHVIRSPDQNDRFTFEELPPDVAASGVKKKKTKTIEVAEAQCWVQKEFKKPFPGLVKSHGFVEAGLVSCEDYMGPVLSLAKRYCLKNRGDSGNLTPLFIPNDGSYMDTVAALIAPFMFFRGSMRSLLFQMNGSELMGFFRNPMYDGLISLYNGVSWGNSFVQTNYSELPWDREISFCAVDNAELATSALGYDVLSGAVEMHYAVGDDFSVGVLSAPPFLYIND